MIGCTGVCGARLMVGLLLTSAILGGVGRRVAGGVVPEIWPGTGKFGGDLAGRAIYGATLAAAAVVGGAVWWHATLIVPAIVLGCATPMWAIDPTSNRADGSPYPSPIWLRCLGNEAHGFLSILLVTLGAWWLGYGWWLILAASLTMLPIYALGWKLAPRPISWLPVGFRGSTEIAEFLWGCTLGAAVFAAAAL